VWSVILLFCGPQPKFQVTTTKEGTRAQGGLTPDFLAFSDAVAGVAIFPNFSAEQGAHGFTDFNDLARQEPHVVTRQLEDVLQQVKGQSLAASQSIELAPAV
jgi:hypothetical protein